VIRAVPTSRVKTLVEQPVLPNKEYVLYWMTSARRTTDNFALQHALHYAETLQKPLLVLEALRTDYPWASDRIHQFIAEGMEDNRQKFCHPGIFYFPYIEPQVEAGKGLLRALAEQACVVITDFFPCFFLPRMIAAASKHIRVRFEQVDSNGVLPLYESPRVFTTAHSFRRHLQKHILEALDEMPVEHPLCSVQLPPASAPTQEILSQWPMMVRSLFGGRTHWDWSQLPIDHRIQPAPLVGGSTAGNGRVASFLESKLSRYLLERNQPEKNVASGLSPYLHFGHISVHSVLRTLLEQEGWDASKAADKPSGSRTGWWGLSAAAEAFIDQIVTWRELGYTFCYHRPRDYDQYESLPEWALRTLQEHATDLRPICYSAEQLERGETHDRLWNAAQNQLREEGQMHNYLRMLWAKKILEWSPSPRVALGALIHLNNRYALDGRNPNSYAGIFWTLGRFDRAWGPERAVFGKIRYMSSKNTARKVRVQAYINRWDPLPEASHE